MNPAKYLVQTRTVLTIYRDCVKLIHRMVQNPRKASAAQALLRKQFEKHKQQFDTDKIHQLKMNAVKGISNYLIYTVQRDYKMLNKKPVNIMQDNDFDLQNQVEQKERKNQFQETKTKQNK